jgi:hypothetical protein
VSSDLIIAGHHLREKRPVLREGKSRAHVGWFAPGSPAIESDFPFAPGLSNFVREAREWISLPLAPVGLQGFVASSRAFRAPLQPDGLAVWEQGRGANKPTARQPSSCAQTRGADMTRHDPEIEELREKVHCAVVLERTPPCWKLDRKESTKLSLKYRRGKGEIVIVSHAGRGWWDPTSDAKGDVFRLVQRLDPGLSFGHVRKRLRAFAGLSPCFLSADRAGGRKEPIEPSPPAGPSERRFGLTPRPGAILDDSAGCRQRSLRRHL